MADAAARIAALEEQLARLQEERDRTVEPPDPDYVDSASQADGAEYAVSTLFLPRSNAGIVSSGSTKQHLLKGVLKPPHRAACRIMYDNGVNEEEIAKKYQRTVDYIKRIITNNINPQDHLDKDYELVDEETRIKYPQSIIPRRCGPTLKRPRSPVVDDHPNKHARVNGGSSSGRHATTESERTQVNDPPSGSANQVTHTTACPSDAYGEVLKFLRGLKPNLERFLPSFQEAGFDDDMLRTVMNWSDEEVNELLGEMTKLKEKKLGVAQRFVVKKGIIGIRRTVVA